LSIGFNGQRSGDEPDLQLLASGTQFHEHYRIVRCIGAGGMGAVYEALHLPTQRRRALKTMLPALLSDAEMRARFKLEATITAEIESDHIVEVFDAGYDEQTGLPFLVMEYLRGESLASRLRSHGPLTRQEVVLLLSQASLALDRTHAAGIVHRDLKPENLFFTRRDDGSPRLKILDFGIAKVVAQSANLATTRNLGTPLYMSPEQIRGDGDIDGRADQYSLAQIAFTLLVGHAYWGPEAQSGSGLYGLLLKVADGVKDSATLRAGERASLLPPGFDAWFAKGTHLLASERFDTAGDLVAALADTLDVRQASPLRDHPGHSGSPAATAKVDAESSTLAGLSDVAMSTPYVRYAKATNGRPPWPRGATFGFLALLLLGVASALLVARQPSREALLAASAPASNGMAASSEPASVAPNGPDPSTPVPNSSTAEMPWPTPSSVKRQSLPPPTQRSKSSRTASAPSAAAPYDPSDRR
jgi:serine/threonine-protein kinase